MDDSAKKEQFKQALITSLRFLAASPKSSKELRQKLAAKGYPEPIIEQVTADLREQGILDDGIYAKDIISKLTLFKSAGKHRIAYELKRRGIPEQLRHELLDSLSSADEFERAMEQARLKWVALAKTDFLKRKKRIYDFLVRKGYDFQIIQDVLQKLLKQADAEE